MGRNKEPIPVKVMARILQNAGAPRVSKEAAKILAEAVQEKAEEIAKKATEIALHAKRRTINDGDVRLAAKK